MSYPLHVSTCVVNNDNRVQKLKIRKCIRPFIWPSKATCCRVLVLRVSLTDVDFVVMPPLLGICRCESGNCEAKGNKVSWESQLRFVLLQLFYDHAENNPHTDMCSRNHWPFVQAQIQERIKRSLRCSQGRILGACRLIGLLTYSGLFLAGLCHLLI
jgi:hypothetical protein